MWHLSYCLIGQNSEVSVANAGKQKCCPVTSVNSMSSSSPLTSETGSHDPACHHICFTWMRPEVVAEEQQPGLQTPQVPIQSSIHGMSRIKCSPPAPPLPSLRHLPSNTEQDKRKSSEVRAARGHRGHYEEQIHQRAGESKGQWCRNTRWVNSPV